MRGKLIPHCSKMGTYRYICISMYLYAYIDRYLEAELCFFPSVYICFSSWDMLVHTFCLIFSTELFMFLQVM